MYYKQKLMPGRYVCFVRILYNVEFQDQYDVNLACYSSTACNIQLASKQQAIKFSGNVGVEWPPIQPQKQFPNPHNFNPWENQPQVPHTYNQGWNMQGAYNYNNTNTNTNMNTNMNTITNTNTNTNNQGWNQQ